MANDDDDSDRITPEDAAEMFGVGTEGFMRDLVESCRRHGLLAVSVCAFTPERGPVTFSTGTDPEWRNLARMLTEKTAADIAEMLQRPLHVRGPLNLPKKRH